MGMIRNDYRRALIMLRSMAKGYSGHVRLERRTLGGSLQFTVNGVNGDAPLNAVMLGDKGGKWHAIDLGPLRRGRSDQAGLTVSFDPRNIQGRELEDYQVIGVVRTDEPQNPLVLSGFVHGSREVDWARVHAACLRLFKTSVNEPVTSLPEASTQGTEATEPKPDEPMVPGGLEIEPDEPIAFETMELESDEPMVPEGLNVVDEAMESTEEDESASLMRSVGFSVMDMTDTEPPENGSALAAMPMGLPWPESILALRTLFEQNPPFEPFAAPNYVFVRAPLPSGEGESFCAIGLKIEGEAFTVLCYAVPGTFALEPPPGLEGYSWRGTGSQGWWTTCIDLESGEPYEGDDP